MSFDSAAVDTLFDKVQSHAMALGVFDAVNTYEPKSAPPVLACAIWVDRIEPVTGSGLSSTSGKVILNVRLYGSMLQRPYGQIDPNALKATTTLITAYSGDFDFGQTVRGVDLLGMYGDRLMARAGYIPIDSKLYRVMTITLPVIINDMWPQAG